MKRTLTAIAALALTAAATGAQAQDNCDPGKPGAELTGDEAETVYNCIAEELHAGYAQGDKRWIPAEHVTDYRDWTRASTIPAAPGFHGNRFLLTWVNDTGDEAYLEYAEDPDIPAGTVIAKESFAVTDAGNVRKGPLFLMEKVAAGTSPETDDWYYMLVAPNGAPQAVNVMTACSECHQGAYGFQGGLGYPVPEARVSN